MIAVHRCVHSPGIGVGAGLEVRTGLLAVLHGLVRQPAPVVHLLLELRKTSRRGPEVPMECLSPVSI